MSKEGRVSAEEKKELEEFTNELLEIAGENSLKEIAEKKIVNTGDPFQKISSDGMKSLNRDGNLISQQQEEELLADAGSANREESISFSEFKKKHK